MQARDFDNRRELEDLPKVRNKTVTQSLMPILIHAEPKESEGIANFLTGLDGMSPVRRLTEDDLDRKTSRGKAAWDSLTPAQLNRLLNLVKLWEGLRSKNGSAIRQAYARFFPALSAESERIMQDLPDDYRFSDRLTELLRESLISLRLVLWREEQKFIPAFYCADFATAFYLRLLLSATRKLDFAVCLHCNQIFFPRRRDQAYCSASHRDIARMNRYRLSERSGGNDSK